MKKMIITILIFFCYQSLESQEFGALVGRIMDEENLALPGANVVLPDLNTGAATDVHGEYRLSPLPPGRYYVEILYIGFITFKDSIDIASGGTTTFNAVMKAGVVELDAVQVVGERLQGQAKALNQQMENFNVTNVVSADQIGRFPDQNIGDALKRIPAISVNYNQGEARYANIRGIGPALNAVTIDGDLAPSADAETRAVQLDLIPAEMIQSVEVNKTITPDMDADAIGGSVNLVTRQAPYARRASLTLGTGVNALTGKPRLDGSFVLGQRFMAEKIGLVFSGSWDDRRFGSHNTEGIWRLQENGAIVPQQWDVRLYDIRRLRKSFSAATDFRLNDENRFFLNVVYNHRDDWENRVRLRYRLDEIDENGISKETVIRRQTKGGPSSGRNNNARLEDQRTQKLQLRGKHNAGDLFQAEWSLSFAEASEERPRERYFSWEADDEPVALNLADLSTPYFDEDVDYDEFKPEDISEEYRKTTELNRRFKIDIDLPIIKNGAYKSTFYIGGTIKGKTKKRKQNFFTIKLTDEGKDHFKNMKETETAKFNRDNFLAGDYKLGRFTTYDYLGSLDFDDETLFENEDDPEKYIAGNYSAEEDVSSAYIMLEQKLGNDVEIKAGLRMENTSLLYRGFFWDEENELTTAKSGGDDYINWMPGVHVRYRPNKKFTVRTSWTNTLSRPNYYDLVPFRSVSRGDEVLRMGNPSLRPTLSENFDAMIEHYSESIGVLSFGVFHKNIEQFIYIHKEHNYYDAFLDKTYGEFYQPRNGADADLFGFELAVQRQLSFFPGVWSNFGLYANYTYLYSRAHSPAFNETIDLPGAAPHTLNLNVTYETATFVSGLSFNYTSPYLDPDEIDLTPALERYYDNVTYLDFNAAYKFSPHLRLFFEAKNLLNQPLRYYAGISERTLQQEFYSYRLQVGIKYSYK